MSVGNPTSQPNRKATVPGTNDGSFAPKTNTAPGGAATLTAERRDVMPADDTFLNDFRLGDVTVTDIGGGRYLIQDGTETNPGSADESPMRTRVRAQLGMDRATAARNRAAAAIARDLYDVDELNAHIEAYAAKNASVTYLEVTRNGSVQAVEGRLFQAANGMTGFLPKGNRNNGVLFGTTGIVDIAPGYGQAASLAQTWARRKAQFTPAVTPLDPVDGWDDVPVSPFDRPETRERIAAVYLIDGPSWTGEVAPGCMFLATDIQRSTDGSEGDGERPNQGHIVNGYFWAPSGHGLVPEHGSMHTTDLVARGAQVTDYEPGSLAFADCFDLPRERTEAYRAVTGRSFIAD